MNVKRMSRFIWIILILLLGILVPIVMKRYLVMKSGLKAAAWKGDLGTLKAAASIYYGDSNGVWPSTLDTLVPKYLKSIPKDPITGSQKIVTAYDGMGGWVYDKQTGASLPNFPTPTPIP